MTVSLTLLSLDVYTATTTKLIITITHRQIYFLGLLVIEGVYYLWGIYKEFVKIHAAFFLGGLV